ncbi:MAG: hypothetical protein IIA64_05760 [Planctomycetes bacterium]|nr:hypothetical protein [Planctomycetota bacterium]
MLETFTHFAARHGWKNGKDPPWPIWLLFSIPRAIRDDIANTEYVADLRAIWKSRWWYETKEHIVIETMVTIGSSAGAAVFTGEFLGKAMLGALVGGLSAVAVLIAGQAIRSFFSVRRSVRRVNAYVQQRFDRLIRFERSYLSQVGLNPNASRQMYEQRNQNARDYISQVDRFLERYYPDEQIQLSRAFVNLKAPPFDDVQAREKHIDLLHSITETGMRKLEGIEKSGRRPKPTPFNAVA